MRFGTKVGLLAGGALLAAWTAWGLYSGRSAESVPYEEQQTVDGIEIRRYPQTVLAETTAPDQITAFRRLFRYISGGDRTRESIEMTAPVATRGASIAMTTPVRTRTTGSGVEKTAATEEGRAPEAGMRMGFYLPASYGPDTAPEPTEETVELVAEPEKTVAVKRFSWYAPAWRVNRLERQLLTTLERYGIEPRGEPYLLRYNDPWTPPFMRRNEIAVEIEARA